MEWRFGYGTVHEITRSSGEVDGDVPTQGGDAVRRVGAAVVRAGLKDGIANGRSVTVGEDVVVAQDVVPGRYADPVGGRADGAAGENVVDAGGDGAGRDL